MVGVYDLAVVAADRLYTDDVLGEIRVLLDQTQATGNTFLKQSLSRRI